jgi:hypothetical protein
VNPFSSCSKHTPYELSSVRTRSHKISTSLRLTQYVFTFHTVCLYVSHRSVSVHIPRYSSVYSSYTVLFLLLNKSHQVRFVYRFVCFAFTVRFRVRHSRDSIELHGPQWTRHILPFTHRNYSSHASTPCCNDIIIRATSEHSR